MAKKTSNNKQSQTSTVSDRKIKGFSMEIPPRTVKKVNKPKDPK